MSEIEIEFSNKLVIGTIDDSSFNLEKVERKEGRIVSTVMAAATKVLLILINVTLPSSLRDYMNSTNRIGPTATFLRCVFCQQNNRNAENP